MFTRITSVVMLITFVCISVVSALATTAGAVPATQVTYPEQTFANGKARHFTYKTDDGVTIRYFIMKSSDGVIRAAFDACDVCWPENKGYTQQGDVMVCNNCGRRFPSTRINEVQGGCNPAPLKRKVEQGIVIIKVADILQGKRYFDFRGGTR
ncbi:MAG: hypothetical protein A2Z19_00370 [Deltaproteobacteria bacterium RBG_16_54_18]|nr:MAG: hypothetical protein A2Z19_00370 [Deltaproteobacteria bacterium RBG_16_54_18]